uniref:Ras like without CAAX 2 n=1 Tax=Sphenodon punctatus TaxID=8508 RepID=A0A8D0L2R3_SPHPU
MINISENFTCFSNSIIYLFFQQYYFTSFNSLRKQFYFIVSLSALFFLPAMTMQFISHQFPDYHDPTIEDAYKTQVRIDDEPAYLDILDTAGQLKFTAMRDQYMRGGEGFIICYSITDRQSFQEAAEFKELIYRVRHTYNIPLVLVGNKIDLEEFRQVSKVDTLLFFPLLHLEFFEWKDEDGFSGRKHEGR